MSNINVAIINYECGNIHSASKALEFAISESNLKGKVVVTNNPDTIKKSDRLVLPGVGAFSKCYQKLNAINGLNVDLDFLIVDGNKFKPYWDRHNECVPHKCIIEGDAKYVPIACASILAKVYHDEYIEKLCEENPELDERYGWRSNMCYGTAQHIEGIKQYGISPYHRKSFGKLLLKMYS